MKKNVRIETESDHWSLIADLTVEEAVGELVDIQNEADDAVNDHQSVE